MSTDIIRGLLFTQQEVTSKFAIFLVQVPKRDGEFAKIFQTDISSYEILLKHFNVDLPKKYKRSWFIEGVLMELLSELLVETKSTSGLPRFVAFERYSLQKFEEMINTQYYELLQQQNTPNTKIFLHYKQTMQILGKVKVDISLRKAEDGINILRTERLTRLSLRNYVERLNFLDVNHVYDFVSKMFEIFYLFRTIKKLYPTFRHEDSHLDNIMLKRNPNIGKYAQYDVMIDGKRISYYLKCTGANICLIDLGNAMCPELDLYNLAHPKGIMNDDYVDIDDVKRILYQISSLISFVPDELTQIATIFDEMIPGLIDFMRRYLLKKIETPEENIRFLVEEVDLDEVLLHQVFDHLKEEQSDIYEVYTSSELLDLRNKVDIEKRIIEKYELDMNI